MNHFYCQIARIALVALVLLPAMLFGESSEAKLKAAYLFQFGKYVEWAPNQMKSITIACQGDAAVCAELTQQSLNRKIQDSPIKVVGEIPADLQHTAIIALFGDGASILESLAQTRGRHALVVTMGEGFLKRGADINLFHEDGRLRFEVNLKALNNRPFRLSSQLLKLARLVE